MADVVAFADFVARRKSEIMDRWASKVVRRLGLETVADATLIDDLPEFIDELVIGLRTPVAEWVEGASARQHGRHRIQAGIDVGALTEEFTALGEAVIELAEVHGQPLDAADYWRLMRLVGRGVAESSLAYAGLRDREIASQAARYFAFVAHELRSPLQTAHLVATLLEHGDGSHPEHLRRLRKALDEMTELVDNSIVDARLYGEPHLDLETVDARELVDLALDNARPVAERRRITLETEIDAFQLDVDRKAMTSVLMNLLINAAKFTHETGRVQVTGRAVEQRAIFRVDDQCGGMPQELPAALFQPFRQRGTDRTGFGLGLMIVKRAVEAHGGSVRVVNRPPEGCSFVVDLPLHQQKIA